MRFNKRMLVALRLALCSIWMHPDNVRAQDELKGPDDVIYFSAGWRTVTGTRQNILQLGTVFHCDQGLCLEVKEYDAAKNTPRVYTPYVHEMDKRPNSKPCTNGPIAEELGDRHTYKNVKLYHANDGTMVLEAGRLVYHWRSSEPPAYNLISISDANKEQEQPVGFAYFSTDTTNRKISAADITYYYYGEIYHKDANATVQSDWYHHPSIINFLRFHKSKTQPLLSLTEAANYRVKDVEKRPLLRSHNSFVLVPPNGDRLRTLLHGYGHDWNLNSCFEELGHVKMLLPVEAKGQIFAFVYVEYSPDLDPTPMLSVGRYFRKLAP
ncbi:MAG: hypothetical protein M9932_17780 [Xanthobacteraceae bacterium]|nr:hypothetical protein [Xanthobacteraceae bacterium]